MFIFFEASRKKTFEYKKFYTTNKKFLENKEVSSL